MKQRLFIAINLPDSIKAQISEIIDKLAKANCEEPIKWVREEQLHLTLHFLGYLEANQAKKVQSVLNNLTKSYPVCQLKCASIDAFPNLNRPRVLVIKLKEEDSEKLVSFQKELGKDLEQAGIDMDHRPWQPHVTLGRIKDYGVKLKIPKVILPKETFEINSVELMESKLKNKGPIYCVVGSFALLPVISSEVRP